MKNVNRTSKPQSLKKYASSWKRELLQEIRIKNGDASKVHKKFFNKYNKIDIKENLMEMFEGLCAYCEENVGVVEFAHIEHRKPKRKYPKDTYCWDNLHLACTTCNSAKGDQWSNSSILDAVEDVPIEKHLTYHCDEEGVWVMYKTKRGKTTIDHTDLNRERLRTQRNKLWVSLAPLILKMCKFPADHPRVVEIKAILRLKRRGRYGSFFGYVVQNT